MRVGILCSSMGWEEGRMWHHHMIGSTGTSITVTGTSRCPQPRPQTVALARSDSETFRDTPRGPLIVPMGCAPSKGGGSADPPKTDAVNTNGAPTDSPPAPAEIHKTGDPTKEEDRKPRISAGTRTKLQMEVRDRARPTSDSRAASLLCPCRSRRKASTRPARGLPVSTFSGSWPSAGRIVEQSAASVRSIRLFHTYLRGGYGFCLLGEVSLGAISSLPAGIGTLPPPHLRRSGGIQGYQKHRRCNISMICRSVA